MSDNETAANPDAPAVPVRVIVIHVKDNGDYEVQQQGVDVTAIPTTLRIVAGQVEKQLGAV
jgi:hypothetical protein